MAYSSIPVIRRNASIVTSSEVVEYGGPMKGHAAAQWMRSIALGAAVAARGNSVSEVLMAVKSGVGLAPLPVPFAACDVDLVTVSDPVPELTFQFYLVVHRDMKRAPAVRAFLDFVTAEIKTVRQVLSGGFRLG